MISREMLLKVGSFVKKDNRGVNERESVITGNLNSTFGAMVAHSLSKLFGQVASRYDQNPIFSTVVTCPFVPVHFQTNARK